jgi:hypothetical protein
MFNEPSLNFLFRMKSLGGELEVNSSLQPQVRSALRISPISRVVILFLRATAASPSSPSESPSQDSLSSMHAVSAAALDLRSLRCRVLRRLAELIDRLPALKSTSYYRYLRFAALIVAATLCERGSYLHFVKGGSDSDANQDVKVVLNCRKVAQKIVGCLTGEYLKTVCETCVVPLSEAEKLRELLRHLDLPAQGDKEKLIREVESMLKNDYVNLLKYLRKTRGESELARKLQKFVQSVFIGRLVDIYMSFIELLDYC